MRFVSVDTITLCAIIKSNASLTQAKDIYSVYIISEKYKPLQLLFSIFPRLCRIDRLPSFGRVYFLDVFNLSLLLALQCDLDLCVCFLAVKKIALKFLKQIESY